MVKSRVSPLLFILALVVICALCGAWVGAHFWSSNPATHGQFHDELFSDLRLSEEQSDLIEAMEVLHERESDDFREREQEWKNRDHALFVGYTPYDDPKYSISVIIEHGGSGASTAAPIAKQVFNYINELEV